MAVVSRFAPSPTGPLHIGSVRTALFAWLFAKSQKGHCLLRLEDTDKERSKTEFTESILKDFAWLNINFDRQLVYQTENIKRHLEVSEELLNKGLAYSCNCSTDRLKQLRENQIKQGVKPKYDFKCRELDLEHRSGQVIRFKNPQLGSVIFEDIVRGSVEISNEQLDDLILVRSDGSPTYNLSVVVDDLDMGITHVIRGDDHINNTPRQINIFSALESQIPVYGHLPMILGEDGKRMSKRHGAVSVEEYKEMGILQEALLNYLVRLGWSKGDEEFFTLDDLLEIFNKGKMNNSPASFSLEKLKWYNQNYINKLDNKEIIQRSSEFQTNFNYQNDYSLEVLSLIKDRCATLKDLHNFSHYFFEDSISFDPDQAKKNFNKDSLSILTSLSDSLKGIEEWKVENINSIIQQVMLKHNVGMAKVGLPFRLALTGTIYAPAIDQIVKVLGKERVLERLSKVISELS